MGTVFKCEKKRIRKLLNEMCLENVLQHQTKCDKMCIEMQVRVPKSPGEKQIFKRSNVVVQMECLKENLL